MLTICSSCGLLSSASQHRSGCTAANTRSPRRSASMAELTNHTDTNLFPTLSNEHTLFAGTLRNWGDPLVQGQEPTPVPLCPRCVACKCESLKDLSNSSASLNHHHHHRHVSSCPNIRQYERAKTSSRPRLVNKPKRRAYSCDSFIPLNSHTSLIKQRTEPSPSPPLTQRKKSVSKIPVRISSATSSSTAASEHSSVSSIAENRSLDRKTKIPRPISNPNSTTTNHLFHTNPILSSADEDLDQDSLNDNADQRTLSMSNQDISPKKKKKNPMMMYCTTTTSTNDFDHLDEQIFMKKKKKMSPSSKKQSHSDSASDKNQRRFSSKEGRHSKSKTTGTSSPINDLSSTTSSSSSSSFTNNCSSTNQLRKKSRPYRLASPSQPISIPSLSDDSLSEQSERLSKKRRPRSALISYESTPPRSSRFESTLPPPPPPLPPPSVYLIELTNNRRPTNSLGLNKTITYVWKNSPKKKVEDDLNNYPRYSVEQVPPIIDQDRRSVSTSSRHITLQRGKTDYWQNMKTSPDLILTSSCQKHTGSASNLLSPTLDTKPNDITRRPNSNGHIISVTTTKRRQPSLLNQSQNTQWNIAGDGKQLRYSNLKWYSVDQLEKDHRLIPKQRIKRKQETLDSPTDTGSSSEQHNQSAPPILQQKSNLHLTKEIHEVLENSSMNKQNDSIIPDYSSFHREIIDTSSPINHDELPPQHIDSPSSSSSSSSSKEIPHFPTIMDENSSPPKAKLNSYSGTDEDVDDFNYDYSDDLDRSTTTIQTYRDRLNTRLNNENHVSRPRIFSTEYSQTIDSGVDILSEQKMSQPKIDEQYSEQTTNQNDLFALSDDSLLDIESPKINELLLKTSSTRNEQSSSVTDESDGGKSYSTALTDYPVISKTDRALTNTSEQYYSADSDFKTSLDPYSGYELENLSDDDGEEKINKDQSPEISRSPSPKFDFKLPSFSDWIDRVFTTFLAETNQQSISTSRSSSVVSIHASQNTIDTSSSQVLTVIENTKNPLGFEENNQTSLTHRRSLSWPNDEQQQDEQKFKDMSSSSLNNENIDFNSVVIDTNYAKSNSINDENTNQGSKTFLLSSIENTDEEVINKETMQNDYLNHHTPSTTTNTDQIHSDDEHSSYSHPTTNIDAAQVEEKEHGNDEKRIEIEVDNNKNDRPLIQVVMPDDSSTFSFYEEFHYREPQQNQHTNSHDSLLQPDHHLMDNMNTTASSTDDLSTTHQLSSSVFHSKDSALGLSDDNLNGLQTNQFIIIDDDEEEEDDDQQEQILSSSSFIEQPNQTVENNVIQDTANNNIDKNEMTYEQSHNNNNENTDINHNTMIWVNHRPQLLSPSYLTNQNERTISSSSSEQLIPKEKKTGMYFRAFGEPAAIHLAEKYHCEWLQDVTSPSSTTRKSSTILENNGLSNSRIFRQHQSIGDDDEFVVTFESLQPSSSCPNLNSSFTPEPLRERSYSLTTLDAYARLDITRDTLEQMWLSLLDLAFSDKGDLELGEYQLRHIRGLSNSYTNINERLIEKSRSHGDIFSTTNQNEKLTTKKSKSFDITSLPKSTTTTDDSANVGLLQGAAISEPFMDRLYPTSIHSDTEPNLLDMDNESIQSVEQDDPLPEEQYSPINQNTSPVIKETLNYVFRYRHQLDKTDDDDVYDLEQGDDITNYLPERTFTTNETYNEDRQLCLSLGFDDDEATAAFAAVILQTNTEAKLAEYRPHSLSTIPSSRASQCASSLDDSDDIIDRHGNLRTSTISANQEEYSPSEHSGKEEEDEKEEKSRSDISSSPSRPYSPIQNQSPTPPQENQQIQPSNFANIDHNAWERSISEPIYSEDLSIQHDNNENFFTFTDNLITIEQLPIDQIHLNKSKPNQSIEQTNLIDFSSQEELIEKMDSQQENKSTNSTHTSLSSIHDTHLDPNELAYRLARLDTLNVSSPPKLSFADELVELGEKQDPFENDSLDHSPTEQKEQHEIVLSTPHTYATGSPPPPPLLQIEELTSIAKDIRQINQEKSISSLCTIIEDIHARTNNQFLTKIVGYHHSPPIANLQTIITELHQTPISKSIPRPQRPTHLLLDQEEEEEEEEQENTKEENQSPVIIGSIPISPNVVSNLEQHLASYKTKSPSPPPVPSLLPIARRISEPPLHATRYHTQRIDKVSDLEIVKQGKGFKIGYVDRQGTDQRVILTKRIEAGPDIMARDPHVRLPYKGRKILNQVYSSVLYTNGYNTIHEDQKFQHSADDIEVPIIGTNPQHFDESDMISIDIDGPSTMLNSICESIVITQGSVYSTNPPKPSITQAQTHPISKSIFDNNLSHPSSRLRHVVLDQHEEYLLDSSRTPTPSNKKNKIEVIDTWQDHTVIDGSSTTWRSPSLQTYKATKHIQPSNTVQHLTSTNEPNTVQMRIAPSHDVKYRTSEHIEIPAVYDWNDQTSDTPTKYTKTTRDIALSPILIDKKHYQTSSTSPMKTHQKVDRSCQYSPPAKRELGLQCHFENLTTSTQVSSHDIPNFFITSDGTQTINDSNLPFDDSGIQTNIQTISPALSIASSENHPTTQPFSLTGADFIRKLDEQRTHASALTVTQYTNGNYYLPGNDHHERRTTNIPPTTLERSADSGILVDEQLTRTRSNKANFALQVDIKGSSSDSEDVSEVTKRPSNRLKPSTNDDLYEHHSELLITTRSSSKSRQNSSSNDKRLEQPRTSSPKEIEQQILQLRRERTHILDLLSLNWSRSNIWVELTEAKLNYIIGETDALLRSLSFDASPNDNERVKLKMHQYEEEMADLTRQRLAVYRERLEDSKKQLDMKIDELELKQSSAQQHSSHYSRLEYTPRINHTRRSKSFLSTSAENLTNISLQETISNHPHFLDVSFLTSTNQNNALPPRYPRVSQQHQSSDTYRTVYRPTPRYPSTIALSNENRYDYPRYRTTSMVTPTGNLSDMQGLSQSQQAILDETDKLVKDSQQFHHESASQFERARESLLSSETSIRLSRANMAASRLSPNSSYLSNDITLAELFKYEQSLAKETAKNTRTYSSISTSAES